MSNQNKDATVRHPAFRDGLHRYRDDVSGEIKALPVEYMDSHREYGCTRYCIVAPLIDRVGMREDVLVMTERAQRWLDTHRTLAQRWTDDTRRTIVRRDRFFDVVQQHNDCQRFAAELGEQL